MLSINGRVVSQQVRPLARSLCDVKVSTLFNRWA